MYSLKWYLEYGILEDCFFILVIIEFFFKGLFDLESGELIFLV